MPIWGYELCSPHKHLSKGRCHHQVRRTESIIRSKNSPLPGCAARSSRVRWILSAVILFIAFIKFSAASRPFLDMFGNIRHSGQPPEMAQQGRSPEGNTSSPLQLYAEYPFDVDETFQVRYLSVIDRHTYSMKARFGECDCRIRRKVPGGKGSCNPEGACILFQSVCSDKSSLMSALDNAIIGTE